MTAEEELHLKIWEIEHNCMLSIDERKQKCLKVITKFKIECREKAYPDTKVDEYIFCGKCGKANI